MSEDQFKILRKDIENVQSTVNVIDRDLDGATKDAQEIVLRLGSVEGELRQLKEMIHKLPLKVADKVDNVMTPATDEVKDLKETIENKKTMTIRITKKRRWYFLFLF